MPKTAEFDARAFASATPFPPSEGPGWIASGGVRAVPQALPEAVRKIGLRRSGVKPVCILSGLLLASGLLGTASYVVRELMAALVLFSVGFAALFLIPLTGLLVLNAAHGGAIWLGIRAPQWNRAGRAWMFEFAHSLQGRHLWRRWLHRIPTPAVPSSVPIEIDLAS